MNMNLFKTVIIKTLPVMAGYLVLGTGFGILLAVNGYGVPWALAISLSIYAGSMQFVGLSLVTGGTPLISIALTTLMVNARHLFYGISMIDRYKGSGLKKLYLMHALTDETYSLLCTGIVPNGVPPHRYYLLVSLCNHFYWVTGCVVGAFIGSAVSFNTAGIDFAMTALFVTIFVDHWLTTKEHRPALIGIGTSLLCLLVFGKENFLIPAMIIITVLLTAIKKPLEKGENGHDQ